jgi:endoglucanase
VAGAGALKQELDLLRARRLGDAMLLGSMLVRGHAVWFTGGTPHDVQKRVRKTMLLAAAQRSVPVLVAYDIPFRDGAQYSAGGAVDTAAYEAWIDGFARGIGNGKAVVILEPDGLGIIPYNTTVSGETEWCRPALPPGMTSVQANQARYDQLNYAVDRLEQRPQAAVYLDGSHAAWLGADEAAHRLLKAGVERAQGFFVNVSNYQTTSESIVFGTRVSACIAGATGAATTHFVIDTSRNGRGPSDMSAYGRPPYKQPSTVVAALEAGNWCNPPGAGAGLRPTAKTSVPLLDAYLWVKVPGESDGSGDVAGGARGWDFSLYNPWNIAPASRTHFDPLWGMVDPAAGAWFPEQALQLAQLADPPLHH